jgi:decaprenyl-phosphate phosphoribosyltransferase
MSLARGLLKTARPKQWVKNVLVFAAPGAAGQLTHGDVFLKSLLAFVAFCFAASGTYFLNDALDHESDRAHPTKRFRPIAAGVVGPTTAKVVAVLLMLVAVGMSIPVSGALAITVVAYIALTISYSLWLKHQPVLDLAAVAGGFVIRAIAGGAATGIPISKWFLVVASAASLFMVTGKRHAELLDLPDGGTSHRSVLAHYPIGFLNYVRAVGSAIAITAYCLWAFDKAQHVHNGTDYWFKLSIVPFVLALLRYALLVEQGNGGAPEEIVVGDRTLQVMGLVWIALFAIGLRVA